MWTSAQGTRRILGRGLPGEVNKDVAYEPANVLDVVDSPLDVSGSPHSNGVTPLPPATRTPHTSGCRGALCKIGISAPDNTLAK